MSDQISLEFRPESESGILLLTGEREDLSGDFLALYIRDGYLEFRWEIYRWDLYAKFIDQVYLCFGRLL